MANNRMYLVCRGCNENFMLGKTMSSGYYAHREDYQSELNDFYDKHSFCGEVHNENQFELSYEIAIDDVKEYVPNIKENNPHKALARLKETIKRSEEYDKEHER